MSEENVEIVRRAIDAFNSGEHDEALAPYAPDAEWHLTRRFTELGEGVYRGHGGMERFWAEAHQDMEELSLSVSDIRAVGEDRVLFSATTKGRGKRSQAPFESPPIWYVVTVRDGLVMRVEAYLDSAQALESAGLSE